MTIWLSLGLVGFIGWGLPRLLKPVSVGAAVAPNPADYADAVVQVYGADVWGERGRFAIHTWIATKAPGADTYTIYHELGWRLLKGISVVSVGEGVAKIEAAGAVGFRPIAAIGGRFLADIDMVLGQLIEEA